MIHLDLIGQVTSELLRKELSENFDQEEGVARFLLHLLNSDQVASICRNIKNNDYLFDLLEVKIPRSLSINQHIDEMMITDEKTTYLRNASCEKAAILLANTNDDQGQSLSDITRIGAKELKSRNDIWVEVASKDLFLTDDQKSMWEQALKGLQSFNECSLDQFSSYVTMTRAKIQQDGIPLIQALGYALPTLRIPRDSLYFESIPENVRKQASRWKKKFVEAFGKRASYLYKQHSNQQAISQTDLESKYEEIKDKIDVKVQDIFKKFISNKENWSNASEEFSKLEWEKDKTSLLFLNIKPPKINIAEQTIKLFEDEFPEVLKIEENEYLNNLALIFKNKKSLEATEDDKEFYENHGQELEFNKNLKTIWDSFIYGKSIDCSDFLVGLLGAIERLFSQSNNKGKKRLKISTQKSNRKSAWKTLNQDVALYFCSTYKGLEKLTNDYIEWDTNYLFKYDELVKEWKQDKNNKKTISTAKAALQIKFDIELSYEDFQGKIQKNKVNLTWYGKPLAIGMELHKDLSRLGLNPFSYSTITQDPINKKGKLQSLSLDDIGTFQPAFNQDRGSLVSSYSKKDEDIEKTLLKNIKLSLDNQSITQENNKMIINSWNEFSKVYSKAIQEWLTNGIHSESIIQQSDLYKNCISIILNNAKGDINRKNILQSVLKLGNVQVNGDTNKVTTIITPWHPMRMLAKSIKTRQIVDLLNYIIASDQLDFGDAKLFFSELKKELIHPYYPEVTVGYQGQMPILLSEIDTVNDYSIMQSPVKNKNSIQTNEDPKEASNKLLGVVDRYLDLQPHERSNLSIILYNCDSARLPETIVNSLGALQEGEEKARCQIIIKNSDTENLNNIYSKLIENNENDNDALAASEVTKDFMARLRIGVMTQESTTISSNDDKVADIVFLQDVISRQALVEWEKTEVRQAPEIINHYPPRWTRRRANTKDELKSTVYLTCPSQPEIGWTYLLALYSLIKGVDVNENERFLPAKQISFRNEEVEKIFEEAHRLGEWVVNYDELLERRQLKNLGVKVIKYQQNQTHGANIIVSSRSSLNLLKVLVTRRLKLLALPFDDYELSNLADKFIEDANIISGDIVLRAAKQGVFAGELIGVVLSKFILQSELEKGQVVGWFFLDDYASWLGQKEEQIADILAMSPRIINDEIYLQIFITESKYVGLEGAAEAKRSSSKQLRDTILRIENAVFGDPGRLDRDLWLSRLSDLLHDGIELPSDYPVSIETLREKLRKGYISIELKGYSHIFLSNTLDRNNSESSRIEIDKINDCYQEVFTKESVKALVIAYYNQKSAVPIRENLDNSKPWETNRYKFPAPRVNFNVIHNTIETANLDIKTVSNDVEIINHNNKELNINLLVDINDDLDEDIILNNSNALKASYHLTDWAKPELRKWIERNSRSIEENKDDQVWVDEVLSKLRMALMSYNLQAKIINHRLTPNAIVIRLKGSDQLKVEDVEKRRSILLTTHALNVINIMAYPGEIVVTITRPIRQNISLADIWKKRKIQSSQINMSYIIGIKEIDGEILYLNLGGDFESGAQHAPHTLIAGETGSGKSVLLQNLILDICVTNRKELVKIYLIDPKFGVDYMHLVDLPHLAEGIIDDQNRAVEILDQLVIEMNDRYQKFKAFKVNNLKSYNEKVNEDEKLPLIFLIHDEFADWMLVEDYKNNVSSIVQRLGVKARAAGIHLIFATQRPDANVFPIQLRDNLGNRLILRVASVGTSEISLGGEKGAEKLLGRGHLLAKLQGEPNLIFVQVPFLSEKDLIDLFTFDFD